MSQMLPFTVRKRAHYGIQYFTIGSLSESEMRYYSTIIEIKPPRIERIERIDWTQSDSVANDASD
jgi:hypothetical protein